MSLTIFPVHILIYLKPSTADVVKVRRCATNCLNETPEAGSEGMFLIETPDLKLPGPNVPCPTMGRLGTQLLIEAS
jgi:hypothetical protein